jgi:hypothetical protein
MDLIKLERLISTFTCRTAEDMFHKTREINKMFLYIFFKFGM